MDLPTSAMLSLPSTNLSKLGQPPKLAPNLRPAAL